MTPYSSAFFILIPLLFNLPIFFTIKDADFWQCPQYNDLSQGNKTQLYGRKWYLYESSCWCEREWNCAVYQYTGQETIQEKLTRETSSTRTLTNFYILNATDTYAITLECTNFGLFYTNTIHILTAKPRPDNTTSLENSVNTDLRNNEILFTLYETRHDCQQLIDNH